ncbi:N-acetylmuramoyl-L-alanine amidase family protein [Thermoflavimicrobium daqui]|jgi:N-acetylmuramoyl-L-alanine amidase|uniref:N-acetylmuramoyl-L-alanine amidase n=1 Tax=Thermoflavimicrobium daqui TaxID=2137476 RepID=A0A364K517_9BACL|nr:N-acetylmuramoyl-L-alanine amidase [Thermoflavimicrobium daqui]RAL24470.1 N-acetylmuramoyl-L-alanine amidase [Thermoflavimicrobium daqui]
MREFRLFIDPGHGGRDFGAVDHGLREKDLTLSIALEMEKIIRSEYQGVKVRMSRWNDRYVSLSQRTRKANVWGADFFLSIHINAGGGTGWESFTYSGDYPEKAKTLEAQNQIHKGIIKRLEFFKDRGSKQMDLQVCWQTNMMAILTENGFVDHCNDAIFLKDHNKISEIARAHVLAIAEIVDWRRRA